jgi:hypothetical protein
MITIVHVGGKKCKNIVHDVPILRPEIQSLFGHTLDHLKRTTPYLDLLPIHSVPYQVHYCYKIGLLNLINLFVNFSRVL